MEALFLELETTLNEELGLYRRLLVAASAMNEALKCESVDNVRKNSKEYDDVTVAIEALEEKRLSQSDVIARHYGLHNHVNLLRITEVAPAADKSRLLALRNELRTAIMELQKKNISNRVLLTEGLGVIAKTLALVATASEKISGYKQKGNKNFSKINRSMINTVI
jgi:flagellar biosynthesis/type III secretory pathway chaperone